MLLLVSKFKMIRMLLNVVYDQVQKSQQKHIIKESNGKLIGYHYLTATSYELSHPVCLSFLTLLFCSFEDTLNEKTIIIRNVTSNHHIRPCVTVIRRLFVSISCDFIINSINKRFVDRIQINNAKPLYG